MGGLSDRRLNIEQDLIERMLIQGRKAYWKLEVLEWWGY